MNRAILIGRLGKDPELKYIESGTAVCNFSIATGRSWTGSDGEKNEVTTWHNIVAWAKQAELAKEYLTKGRQVAIEGRIDNRSYEKKDGTTGYISEVVADRIEFIGNREDGGSGKSQTTDANQGDVDDDGLPF